MIIPFEHSLIIKLLSSFRITKNDIQKNMVNISIVGNIPSMNSKLFVYYFRENHRMIDMHFKLVILFSLLNTFVTFGQSNKITNNPNYCFFIEYHAYQSEKFTDRYREVKMQELEDFKSGKSITPPPPPAYSLAPFNSRERDYMYVTSDKIFFWQTPRFHDNEISEGGEMVQLRSVVQNTINRDSLTLLNSSILLDDVFNRPPQPIKYISSERLPIVSTHKEIRKKINGIDCYKVVLKDLHYRYGDMVEMYVTEDIKLEYHPQINVKDYLDQFFPLYVKFYNQKMPEDCYSEFTYSFYEMSF